MKALYTILSTLVFLFSLTAVAHAQFAIPDHVVGSGGGSSSNSQFRVRGTVGEPAAGKATSTTHMNSAGFVYIWAWPPLVDVTAYGHFSQSVVQVDTTTGAATLTAAWRNGSAIPLGSALRVVIVGVTPISITVTNADGQTVEGMPYFDFVDSDGDGQLAPAESTTARELQLTGVTSDTISLQVEMQAVLPHRATLAELLRNLFLFLPLINNQEVNAAPSVAAHEIEPSSTANEAILLELAAESIADSPFTATDAPLQNQIFLPVIQQ